MSARNISLVIAFAALAMPVGYAAGEVDQKPAEPAAAAPMQMPMPMPMTGCGKMARHDHGAERGTPAAMPHGCGAMQAPAADKASPRAKAKKIGHDHARTHKLM
ncbi:MAG: hypothetical protein Q8R01_17275 [Ramlibacter sp.]|nr:hypothetical protein [Ramlibacter sp.]